MEFYLLRFKNLSETFTVGTHNENGEWWIIGDDTPYDEADLLNGYEIVCIIVPPPFDKDDR